MSNINAQELRIGNLVNSIGELTIINAIQFYSDGYEYVSTLKSGVVTIDQIESVFFKYLQLAEPTKEEEND
jgi:hypothetical protein